MADFDSARMSALMQDLLSFLQRKPTDLLLFHEVRERLNLQQIVDRGVQEVPMDRIVGTVGREKEFTRAFLPREESLRQRWKEVKDLAEGPEGFPSVELYYVNDIYFVVDGHHRVSVEKSLGAKTIESHVKEFLTTVPLHPETTIEEVILKSSRADFLATTGLTQESPDEFLLTVPNGYERLIEHINGHRYYRGVELKRDVSLEEATGSWVDSVYRPMIEIIRKSGVLQDFEGYTEADLYLFTMDHLHHLRQQYGDSIVQPERAVLHFRLSARSRLGWIDKLKLWMSRLFR